MLTRSRTWIVLTLLGAATLFAQAPTPGVQRKILLQQDLAIPEYQAVLLKAEVPAGGREGRHTHPGTLVVYVESGMMTLEYEGKPTKTYKPGESFLVEPGKVHEGINMGSTPVKTIATMIVEKGKPLTTQVK